MRVLDVIRFLRTARRPVTARQIAARLEVTPRTIYRDIATLQARHIPIEGAPGVGYVLRSGFDLPPLSFTIEEVEAIAVGVQMVRRLRDAKPENAAGLREAIRTHRKLQIDYVDSNARRTRRALLPLAMIYYVDVTLVAAWCKLREDFRHFRIERVRSCRILDESFVERADALLGQWRALNEQRAETG